MLFDSQLLACPWATSYLLAANLRFKIVEVLLCGGHLTFRDFQFLRKPVGLCPDNLLGFFVFMETIFTALK